jgi:hypothetical protein
MINHLVPNILKNETHADQHVFGPSIQIDFALQKHKRTHTPSDSNIDTNLASGKKSAATKRAAAGYSTGTDWTELGSAAPAHHAVRSASHAAAFASPSAAPPHELAEAAAAAGPLRSACHAAAAANLTEPLPLVLTALPTMPSLPSRAAGLRVAGPHTIGSHRQGRPPLHMRRPSAGRPLRPLHEIRRQADPGRAASPLPLIMGKSWHECEIHGLIEGLFRFQNSPLNFIT